VTPLREFFGVAPAWHYGKSRMELKASGISDEVWAEHVRALENREPFLDFTFKRSGPDGDKWLSTSGVPIINADGEFQGYRGIGRDQTAQIESKERASLLSNVVNSVDDAISIFDQEDRLAYYNDAYATLSAGMEDALTLGTTYEQILRASIAVGRYPETEYDAEAWIQRCLIYHRESGEPIDIPMRDGGAFQFNSQRLANGLVVHTSTDVSERRKLTEEIDAARDRFTDFANMSVDWYWEQDADLRFTYFSESAENISARITATTLGLTRRESAPGGVSEQQWIEHDGILARREPLVDFQFTRVYEDGEERILTIQGRPFHDAGGNFAGYRGTGRDDTDQVKLIEQLRESEAAQRQVMDARGWSKALLKAKTDSKASPRHRRTFCGRRTPAIITLTFPSPSTISGDWIPPSFLARIDRAPSSAGRPPIH
jgi:PAS domain-containing protein